MRQYTREGRVSGPIMRQRQLVWSIGGVYVATWVVISWLSSPAFDSYGDMVENYAWSQTWALGSFKHPPLFAWIVGVWFAIFPTQVWPYYVLSYLNAWAGLLGIVALARLWLPDNLSAVRRDVFETAVLLFGLLSLPYSNLAAKFNADTVLLSLWPWTAFAFFAALHASGSRRAWRFTVLLGAMAAAAMLGKYYSALLLVSLVVISLAYPDYRRWYRSKDPYVALVICALLLLPHALWEIRVGMPFVNYLDTKIDPRMDLPRDVVFLLSGIYYLILSWLAWLILRTRFAASEPRPVALSMPLGSLVLLCTLPALITGLFNVFARVHLTTHWAIPVWFAVPALLGLWLLPYIGDDFAWRRLWAGLAVCWAALVVGAAIYTLTLSKTANPKYSLARQEMVRAIETRFAVHFPQQRLSWAGGTWPEPGALAFFAPNHPRAMPGLPDGSRALVNPYPAWQDQYGAIICFAADRYGREGSHNTECEDQTSDWLRAHHREINEETLSYHAEGWQFIRAEPKNVTVFWVPPVRE
jgi:hypothetical protein